MNVNDKFGYHVSGNHQIQTERPFKQSNQRGMPFRVAESVQTAVFATSAPPVATTTTTTAKPALKPKAKEMRSNLAPTSFVHHANKKAPDVKTVDKKPVEKPKLALPSRISTSYSTSMSVTPATSSLPTVHAPRDDDKKQLSKNPKPPKKYFPEPVKMTISPRFESLRLKSPEAKAQAAAATNQLKVHTPPMPLVPAPQPTPSGQVRPINPFPFTTTTTAMPLLMSSPWRTNSRFSSWNSNVNNNQAKGSNINNNNHHHKLNSHFDDDDEYIPGDVMPSHSAPQRFHVEGPRGSRSPGLINSHFADMDNFEGTSASDEVSRSINHPSGGLTHAINNNNGPHTPSSFRVAVQNHPDLTEKQRDSLLKILESYYKLIHQFNLDFRRLINDNRGKSSSKQNGTIVIEPLVTEPSFKSEKFLTKI